MLRLVSGKKRKVRSVGREGGGEGSGGGVCSVPTESFPHEGPRAVFVNCTLEQQGVR